MRAASLNSQPLFPLLGEALSLDLVNTRIRRNGNDVDLLDSPAALMAWLAAQPARQPWSRAADEADLDAIQAMRAAIAALVAAGRAGSSPPRSALRAVNSALALPAPAEKLLWKPARPHMKAQTATAERNALLRALAVDAADLLTGPRMKLLRVCEHPDCVLQFLARDPRRRWCSAALCGNRARVARHYHRRQGRAGWR